MESLWGSLSEVAGGGGVSIELTPKLRVSALN